MTDTNNGSALGGQPGGAAAGDGGAGAGAGAGSAAPFVWNGVELDADTGAWVQSKAIPDVKTALTSYRNLETLLGADKAGRAIVPPKDDAPAEEWLAFWNKLGRPETADGYKLPVPEGDAGEFAKVAASWFHEAGIPAKQAQKLAAKWNEFQTAAATKAEAEFTQKSALDLQELQKAWGGEFEANAELARRARREAGLSDDEGIAIERALGVKKAAEVFSFLGKQFAEAAMKGGEGPGRGVFGATPQEAKARIEALKGDADWTAKYLNGDIDARAEFERLHRIAYPTT